MSKEISLSGCVEVQDDVTVDDFYDAFIAFVESKGWFFGGGIYELPAEDNGTEEDA